MGLSQALVIRSMLLLMLLCAARSKQKMIVNKSKQMIASVSALVLQTFSNNQNSLPQQQHCVMAQASFVHTKKEQKV